MTLATLKPEIEPIFEYPRLRDRPINFAGMRNRTDLYEKIFKHYCPLVQLDSIDMEQRRSLGWHDHPVTEHEDHGEEPTGEVYKRATGDNEAGDPKMRPSPCTHFGMCPDPDVIYIGRIIDGLVWAGVFASRQTGKHLLDSVGGGGERRVSGLAGLLRGGESANFIFEPVIRNEMIESAKNGVLDGAPEVRDRILNGESPRLNLSAFIKDTEPGEVINSSHPAGALLTNATSSTDMWAERAAESDWVPEIRVDSRFGLHYLKRGDKLRVQTDGWPRPSSPLATNEYILRPPSEGPSHVPTRSAEDGVVNL